MRFITSTFLFLILQLSLISAQDVHATFNYKPYPELPFDLDHLMLNLTVDPDAATIKGIGRYDIISRREALTEVVLHTADLEIQEISVGDEQLEYHISGDSLVIQLSDTFSVGEKTQFHITWQSSSSYGIHSDANGFMWTALNPQTNHHWFPIFDHPEMESTVEAYITIPANMEAVFNGKFRGDEVTSTNQKRVEWMTSEVIPVTGINLALGNFNRKEATSGLKEISLFTGEGFSNQERDNLLQTAATTLRGLERNLSFEYPFEALNIVVLQDPRWDEIHTGAGNVYIYQNLGSLSSQLKRGIAAQWFGQNQRYLDAVENIRNYEFLKVLLLNDSDLQQLDNPDSLQSIKAWNTWVSQYENPSLSFLRNTAEESLTEIVRKFSGVTSWNDYADFWYQETGYYWESLPNLQAEEEASESAIYTYNVEYVYDEMNSTLDLIFDAEGAALETLAGLQVKAVSFGDSTITGISFTGQRDTVNVNITSDVEYVILTVTDEEDIELHEQKPFMFLINQLRSEVPEERAKAAEGLKNHSDEPDLELAIRDVLRNEEHPEVRAALLETLGEIIQGATGTEQTFLNEMNSEHQSIRIAAIKALSNYEGNENVQYSIRNAALRAESDSVYQAALNTYQQIAGSSEVISLAENAVEADSTGFRSLMALKAVVEEDTSGDVFEAVDRFLNERYPYAMRKEALNLLLNHQNDADYWRLTLSNLFEDRDPRIRYAALQAIEKLPTEEANEMLNTRANEEFDPRILQRIERLR